MKNLKFKIIFTLIVLLILFIIYYVTLPAINIHSVNTWWFLIVTVLIISTLFTIKKNTNDKQKLKDFLVKNKKIDHKSLGLSSITKIGFLISGILILIFIAGSILSSPIVNAKKYQQLMKIENKDFVETIEQADFNSVPILDKDSASLLGSREMGSMVDMVSQFEISEDYSQINVSNRPVRVAPLAYASPIKWLTNQKEGIPAYMQIDMATQDAQCIKLTESIKYSKSEYFNRNIYRHLRFKYPTAIFDNQIFFEVNDEGIPYWICPVKKFNIGLFGGQTVGRVILCDAVTGECTDYDIDDVPQWVDKVYQAELLINLYNYSGTLKHGYFNSILGQKDCLQATSGYNYIAKDDDVWVYSGVTSVSGDQSNVGFILMNQRTMETHFYKIEGATEESAMSSAQGQVQHLGYRSTFPLLLNISDEPTYFMSLKDEAGLVKMYAMVNIQKYQWVATGDTVNECKKNYNDLLQKNGLSAKNDQSSSEVTGTIENIMPVMIEGNTHIYFTIRNKNEIFDVDITNLSLIDIVKYKEGDTIKISFSSGENPVSVTEIK